MKYAASAIIFIRSAGVSGAVFALAVTGLGGVAAGTVVGTAVGFTELADFLTGDDMMILQVTGL